MKKSYFFSAILTLFMFKVFAQPVTSAPTPPARNAANVISVYNDAPYTSLTGTDFNPNWGQSGFATASEITIGASDKVRKYANINYQGMQFANAINASSMTYLHVDVWTSDCTKLDVYPIVPGQPEQFVSITPVASGWKSMDIALSSYTIPLNNIIQFKFVSTPFGGPTVYLDNLYFWTAASLPTITGFSMPSNKIVGDAPFTITQPSSNSAGAFTYSSSNTDVATISGNTITITGSGTSTITASQAASGAYAAGSATAPLTVGFNPPAVAAATPTALAPTVISLFSNAYTNRTIDTWSASWGQATFKDTTAAGNDIKRYTNLNYCGIEFTGPNSINATSMLYYNVDVWTPNPTPVKVKLVDFGANNAYDGGGDDRSSIEYVLSPAPTPGVWNHYSIPFSSFTGLDTRANLSQMLFVGSNTTIFIDNVYLSTVTTLPVTLSSFTATKNGNATVLSWKTLSELNNKGFGVERSADGINFSQIQFVNGNGSTSAASQYNTTDNSPLNGTNYYRLRQVDNDGKQTYSSTVSVNFSTTDKVGFSFYPNPVKTKIVVALQTIGTVNASISLVNADGRTIKTMVLTNQNSNSNVQFDVANIARGNYFLVLKDGASTKTSKVVVN